MPVSSFATVPDLLRLLAVPVLGWAALRDLRTRRVPNRTWYPLAALALALLLWEGARAFAGQAPPFRQYLFAVHVAVSVGLVVPLAYLFWRVGGFGGADAKAVMVLAVLFPEFPAYALPGLDRTLPLVAPPLGVFSLTILTDAVLLGALYPVVLAARNLAAGRRSLAAFVGLPVHWTAVETTHGRLLETESGLTRRGLDLDALRMYLRWRDLSLADLREEPSLRDPATLPEDPRNPTDGAVRTDGGDAATAPDDPLRAADPDDPWGAAAFLAAIDHSAYGTTPAQLRAGLDLLADEDREEVWVTPGIPFLVPVFAGLLVALVLGDVLFVALGALGLASAAGAAG